MVAFVLESQVLQESFYKHRWKEPLYYASRDEAQAHANRVATDIADERSTTKAFYGPSGAIVTHNSAIAVLLTIYPIHIQEPARP